VFFYYDSTHWVWFVLQDSVPHLKTRLQLQQVIMKELLQKIIAEKRNANVNSPSTTSESTPPSNQASGSQSVTAVQVPSPVPASGVVKAAAIPGSKVTVGAMIPNPAASSQLQLPPQAFSQAALDNLSVQLPKPLREKIAKLPKEQQRFVYMHHLRQLQQLKEQQKQQQQQKAGGTAAASPKVIFEKQRQEQQVPLVVGAAKPAAPMRNVSATVSVGSSTADTGKGKGNFATMKIVPGASPSHGGAAKRKGKGKETGPDIE
jgi:hypothetical protein